MQTQRTRRQARNFAIRLVVFTAVLMILGRVYGTTLVAPILPALAWVIEAADDRFRVDRIEVVNERANTNIQLKVSPMHPIVIGDRMVLPDAKLSFEPSTLVGSVVQPVIVFLTILLAWPATRLRTIPLRLLLALPVTVVLIATNVPLGLLGAMQDYRQYFPDAPVHPLVYWNDFLQTGGPLAMAISAGVLVLWAADRSHIKSA
jgi:hypothetical protein